MPQQLCEHDAPPRQPVIGSCRRSCRSRLSWTQEICDRLSLTRTNCQVSLHRAKARLRELLQDQWGTPCEAIR